jgi:hypothetical protein
MDIARTILEYQTMQAVAEGMARHDHPCVQWVTSVNHDAVYDFGISLDVESRPGFVVCSGEAYSSGEDRPFEFWIPVVAMREAVESRLPVTA